MSELCYLSIAEAARLIQSRKLSPVELTQAYLDRIERLDARLRSFITLTADLAMKEAKRVTDEISRGRIGGPLQGIPVTYKDSIATAGVRTTAASRVYEDWVPEKDANVVARLRKAGSIMLGKVSMSEFAFEGGATEHDFIKPPRNPWNADYSAGGSSSGSAVGVAAGLTAGSVGADAGGSIRIPAACCGIVGLKPTYGLVGRSGLILLSYSLDHLGPMARSVEDAAIMLESLAGYDAGDRASIKKRVPPFRKFLGCKNAGLRLGLCPSYTEAVGGDDEMFFAFETSVNVFRSLGFRTQDVVLPHLGYACAASYNNIMRIEAFCAHFNNFRHPLIRSQYGRAFRNIARGGFLSTVDYFRGQQARSLISKELAAAFENIDVLLMPTTTSAPGRIVADGNKNERSQRVGTDPKVNQENFMHGAAYTAPFDLTGSPALSMPCGFTSNGLPLSMQLIGRPFEEATLLAVGHQYQQVTNWHRQRPHLGG